MAGGNPAKNIARWNGATWSALGGGVFGSENGFGVRALCVLQGDLIAGGFFTQTGNAPANHIARWNGAAWSPMGSWSSDAVYSLGLFQDELVAGSVVWFEGSGTWENMISRWNGTAWQPLGSGPLAPPFSNAVRCLTVYGGELVAGGFFPLAGGGLDNHIARWDGGTWKSLGSGTNDRVYALAVHGGNLIAGGVFTLVDGKEFSRIAAWDGSSWHPLSSFEPGGQGLDGPANALTLHAGALIAGGTFTHAGSKAVNNIASRNAYGWSELGTGIEGTVYALSTYNGDLIAGGSFYEAGGVLAYYIARWDGSLWHPLGTGMNAPVRALAVLNGSLIAGGDFTWAGEVAANRIAAWDGDSWHPLGAGLTGGSLGVRALTLYQGDLVAGGFFTLSDSTTLRYVARWNGASWSPVGTWTNDAVYSLAEFAGKLVAGSVVWTQGTATWANLISSFDGSSWAPLGAGPLEPPFSTAVRSLATYNGKLMTGGLFPLAGGTLVHNLGGWNGTSWSPLGSGTNDNVFALAADATSLYAAGVFNRAGGKPSYFIAHWVGDTPAPIDVQELEAASSAGHVRLTWKLSDRARSETAGVRVQRAEVAEGPYVDRSETALPPAPTMLFEDLEVQASHTYWYRLVLIARGGAESSTGPVQVTAAGVALQRTELHGAFEPTGGGPVQIRYGIGAKRAAVRLEIYDVRGRRVRTLVAAPRDPGEYVLAWDRRDLMGRAVVRGLYFVQLEAERVRATRKLVLLHE
jgi:hypothetical protein